MLNLRSTLPTLPTKLREEAYQTLDRFLGVSTEEVHVWLTLALTHSSYLNDVCESGTADLLRGSGSLLMTYGKVLPDLIIYHWAGENLPSASCGQADEFHQNAERVARDTLADELELGKWVLLGRGEALAINDGKLPARLLRGSVESLLGVAGLFCSYGRLYQWVDSCLQQAPARQGDVSISHNGIRD